MKANPKRELNGIFIPLIVLLIIVGGYAITRNYSQKSTQETWMLRYTMFDQSTVTDTIQKNPLDKFYYKSGCVSIESNTKQYRLVKCGVESFKANLIWP